MTNYPYYQAMPQYPAAGYRPLMQTPVAPMPPMGVKGRPVASVDEVKAAQIELDGSMTYFPCPAERAIYTKAIDLNGMPIIQTYKLANNAGPNYATFEQFEQLQERLAAVETTLKGAKRNESYADYASNEQQQSNANGKPNVRQQSYVPAGHANGAREKS